MEQNVAFENGSKEAKLVVKVIALGWLGLAIKGLGFTSSAICLGTAVACLLGSRLAGHWLPLILAIDVFLTLVFAGLRKIVTNDIRKLQSFIEQMEKE